MSITFHKYQGTGNDFVIIDHRGKKIIDHENAKLITFLCDRRFGIGADGLILLENSDDHDFRMVYFNADGKQSTMCGNGGRCLVQFAHSLGIFKNQTTFEAIDGLHEAKINEDSTISLQMSDVNKIIPLNNNTYELNTGSPHYVAFCDNLPEDIKTEGAKIRYSDRYASDGINVNFVQPSADVIQVATYERGVEDETYSCGTGVTAAAIAYAIQNHVKGEVTIQIKTKGGPLSVSLVRINDSDFKNIWLKGPAVAVFTGQIDV